ncbi:MAG: DUF2851 family protein [Kiritimatiellae bacterium]|nr:DUF2851 family protein [Kiritimatiellia bacterium]
MPLDDYFPLAARYRGGLNGSGAVREAAARFKAFPYTERHLQCVWFDPALRPNDLRTSEGEAFVVDDPGVWNLEAGPDFIGASLRLGSSHRRVRGDVEIHIHPGDWMAHKHRDDPRYANVCAHVTFFSSVLAEGQLPAGAVQVALRDALAAQRGFSFDAIDISAYPYAVRAAVPPCQELLRAWSVDEKQLLLDAAGQERLRRKAERLSLRLQEIGADQLIYEETLAVLGYKHNKQAFRALAERAPVVELRDASGGCALVAQAILLGVAGLIPQRLLPRWDERTRSHVRALWDAWFRHRERWADRIMEAPAWRTAGLRPVNNPVRRIAAVAPLFIGARAPLPRLLDAGTRNALHVVKTAGNALQRATDGYWSRRLSWGGKETQSPTALIGKDRVQLWVTNFVVPFLAADGVVAPYDEALLGELSPEGDNQIVRQAALNLFGAHHPASWYRSGMRKQGLIQIFQDYCLNDRSRCAQCAFPELLRQYRANSRD